MKPRFPKFKRYKDYDDWYIMKCKGCEINLFFTKSGKVKEYSIFADSTKVNMNVMINGWNKRRRIQGGKK